MAYLYRIVGALLLAIAMLAPGAARASFPATDANSGACEVAPCYHSLAYVNSASAWGNTAWSACQAAAVAYNANPAVGYTAVATSAVTNGYCYFNMLLQGAFHNSGQSPDTQYSMTPVSPSYSCPSNSTLSGSSCTCTAPNLQNAANNGCYNPQTTCAAGASVFVGYSLGWKPAGTVPMNRVPGSFCLDYKLPDLNAPAAPICITSFSTHGIVSPDGPSVNGAREWFEGGDVAQTATACTQSGPPALSSPPPPCLGQQGTVNGVVVCMAAESDASKEQRAKDVADTAARLAAAAAVAAGKTPAEQAAAAQAASAASYITTMGGGSAAAAAAAGAAAGASSFGAGSGQPTLSAAAGAGAAAGSTASAAALAAGKSPAQAAAAAAAASAAASAAALAGQSAAAQAAAGSAAGSAAANGSSEGDAAAAGGSAAGGVSGVPGGGGGAGGDGIKGYCIEHPGANICKQGSDSTFTGVCASPPVCTGDAVLCAVAAATWKQECSWHPPVSAQSTAFDDAKVKTGNQTTDLPGNRTESISSSSFDSTELLGAPSGMSDLSVMVMGSSILLPFSSINIWLERLGLMLRAVTLVLCMRIVTRG